MEGCINQARAETGDATCTLRRISTAESNRSGKPCSAGTAHGVPSASFTRLSMLHATRNRLSMSDYVAHLTGSEFGQMFSGDAFPLSGANRNASA